VCVRRLMDAKLIGKTQQISSRTSIGSKIRDLSGSKDRSPLYFIDIIDDSIMHFRKYVGLLYRNFCPDILKYFSVPYLII
jgi:hypothetical protein